MNIEIKSKALPLTFIFSICALLLILTVNKTKEPIAIAQEKHEQALLAQIYPLTKEQQVQRISDTKWLICQNGKLHGEIHKIVSNRAYADVIHLLVGTKMVGTKNHQITAVRVFSHSETPGLGDRIESSKSTWLTQFNFKSLHAPSNEKWAVKKDRGDFQQLSAATITSRAVIDALKEHLVNLKNRPTAPNCN